MNAILTLQEEAQFIQRLRYLMLSMPEGAKRDSYLFVDRGHCISNSSLDYSKTLATFETIQKIRGEGVYSKRRYEDDVTVKSLVETHARVVTERAYNRAKHQENWIEYSKTLSSNFKVLSEVETKSAFSESAIKEAKSNMSRYQRSHNADMRAYMQQVDPDRRNVDHRNVRQMRL